MNFLAFIDPLIICLYIICIILAGLWFSKGKNKTSQGYFLAGRSLTWSVIGASLFASNISTVHLVGLAESGYMDGILWGNFEWFAVFELLILAFVFVPFYLRAKVNTLPEFLNKRYDNRSRVVLAIFSIMAALFMHIGASFYAGAIVFREIFGLDIFLSIAIIAIATGIYTIAGGLNSVVITETVQTIILIAGSTVLMTLAIMKLPEVNINSYEALKDTVGPERLKAVSFSSSDMGFSFFDMLFGHLILGIWYWCTDQTIAQRILGARDENQAKLGAIFAAFLKILPVFIMVVPGILAYALFKDSIEDTKSVLPVLIMKLMPVGLKGFMIAALLAAVMSSVAAALNSCSTLVVYDVAEKIRPNLMDRSKIRIGRITGIVVLILAVIWSPFLGDLGGIFQIINQMFAIFSPPIVTVFLWGIISKKGTANASFWTLVISSFIALCVFITEKYIPINGVKNIISSQDGLNINWLQQTYMYFLLSSAIYWTVTFFDTSEQLEARDMIIPDLTVSSRVVKYTSIVLLVIMLILYTIFY